MLQKRISDLFLYYLYWICDLCFDEAGGDGSETFLFIHIHIWGMWFFSWTYYNIKSIQEEYFFPQHSGSQFFRNSVKWNENEKIWRLFCFQDIFSPFVKLNGKKIWRIFFFFHLIPFFVSVFRIFFFSVKFQWNTFPLKRIFISWCEVRNYLIFLFFAEFFYFKRNYFILFFRRILSLFVKSNGKNSGVFFFYVWDGMKNKLVGDFFCFSEEFFCLEAVKYFFF